MFKILVLKEFRQNLLSYRFLVGFIFVVALYAAGSIVFCKKYQNQLSDFQAYTVKYDSSLAVGARGLHALYWEDIYLTKEPRLSSFIASGSESRYPNSFGVRAAAAHGGAIFSGMSGENQRQNFELGKYDDIDIVFIVGIVLSFLTVVMSFDAISHDREEGTLKQQLANAVSRTKLLLAKYVAVMIALFVPILVGSLIAIALIQISLGRNIIFSYPALSVITAVLSIVYLSLFVWLSFLVSSMSSKSSTSLAVLLLIWTFWVFIVPYLGGTIATRFYPITSQEEHSKQFQALLGQVMRSAPIQFIKILQSKGSGTEDQWRVTQDFFARSDNRMEQFQINRFHELVRQAKIAEDYNSFSPYSSFRRSAELLSNTGLAFHQLFFNDAVRYRHELDNFIVDQDKLDPVSPHHIIPFPGLQFFSNKPVDVKIIPRFAQPAEDEARSIQQSLPFVGYLVILNLLFLSLAVIAFARADVR